MPAPTRKKRMVMKKRGVRHMFSARLREAMSDAGKIRHRGSLIGPDVYQVMELLKLTRTACRKYLTGEALPDPENIAKLAEWTGVNISWLRDGVGPKTGVDGVDSEDMARDDQERLLLKSYRKADQRGKEFLLKTVTVIGAADNE